MRKKLLAAAGMLLTGMLSHAPASAQNYVVGQNGTVLRTDNQGKNFKVSTGLPATGDINSVAVAGADTVLINAGTSVYRSTDSAGTFVVTGQRASSTQYRLATFNSGRVYSFASAYNTHPINNIRSLDFGKTFTDQNHGRGNATAASTFKNANHDIGYAVLQTGRLVHRTTNGGVTWTDQFRTFTYRAVKNYKPNHVIVAGDDAENYRSTDNGATWVRLMLPGQTAANNLLDIEASATGDTILAVGGAGYMARSADGGDTWTQIATGHSSRLNKLFWKTADTVWLAGDAPNGQLPYLAYSANGGETFTRITDLFPGVTLPGNTRNISVLTFSPVAGEGHIGYGFLTSYRTEGGENFVMKTTDGGFTWALSNSPLNARIGSVMHALSADTVIMSFNGAYNSGRIFRSVNGASGGGANNSGFAQMRNDGPAKRDIEFFADGTGIIVGTTGIWRTTDRGATWNQETDVNSSGDYFATSNGFVVGAFNIVKRTMDFDTYTDYYPQGFRSGNFRAIIALDSNWVFAAGDNGTIFRSTDRGDNWATVADTNFSSRITGIAGPNRQYIYAVTMEGSLLSSADSGNTWSRSQVANVQLNDIRFKDSVGIIVGNGGVVLRSQDYGMTWNRVYAGTNLNLNYAYFGSSLDTAMVDSVEVKADTVNQYAGVMVEMPVRVRDFEGIRQLQGSLSWDTSKVSFMGVSAFNLPGLVATNFNTAQSGDGVIGFNWSNPTPATLANDDVIFHVQFMVNANAAANDSAVVSFDAMSPFFLGGLDSNRVTLNAFTFNGLVVVEESPTIETTALTMTDFCPGDSVTVNFTVTGGDFAPGNEFAVQLSDATGDFTTPTQLGVLAGITSGSLRVGLPVSQVSGTAYRIRVVGVSPAVMGTDNGSNLTINELPATPLITGSGGLAICEGDSVTLNAPAGFATYAWTNGATTQSIVVKEAGSYRVAVTNASGCGSDSSVASVVSVNPLPAAPAVTTSRSLTLCAGESVTLTATAGFATYAWTTGETTQSIVVNAAGSYRVAVTNANGCASDSSVVSDVVVNPLPATPVLTLGGAANDEVTSNETGATYIWSYNGVVLGFNTQTIPAQGNGSYTLQIVSAAGCSSAVSAPLVVTNVASQLATQVSVYPNPATDNLNIELSSLPAGEVTYQLMDATGKAHRVGVLQAGSQMVETISLKGVPSGMYVLQLSNGNSRGTHRVVVAK